jgi:hypothetical protein
MGFPSCSTSSAGEVWAKIATIGRNRKPIATTAAATYATPSRVRRTLLPGTV